MKVYPNPNDGNFVVKYHLTQTTDVKITLYAADGKLIEDQVFKNQPIGENTFSKYVRSIAKGGVYILTIETAYEKATQKVIIER